MPTCIAVRLPPPVRTEGRLMLDLQPVYERRGRLDGRDLGVDVARRVPPIHLASQRPVNLVVGRNTTSGSRSKSDVDAASAKSVRQTRRASDVSSSGVIDGPA